MVKKSNKDLYIIIAIFLGLIVIAGVIFYTNKSDTPISSTESQEEAKSSGCTNTCATNNNQKTFPDCSCYKTEVILEQQQAEEQQADAPVTEFPCSDSDGGQDFMIGGTAREYTVVNNVNVVDLEFKDECNGAGGLKEYYCSNNNIEDTTYACPSTDCGAESNQNSDPARCTEPTLDQLCVADQIIINPDLKGIEMTSDECDAIQPLVQQIYWKDGRCCYWGDA